MQVETKMKYVETLKGLWNLYNLLPEPDGHKPLLERMADMLDGIEADLTRAEALRGLPEKMTYLAELRALLGARVPMLKDYDSVQLRVHRLLDSIEEDLGLRHPLTLGTIEVSWKDIDTFTELLDKIEKAFGEVFDRADDDLKVFI